MAILLHERYPATHRFCEALYALLISLYEPDLMAPGEQVVIELPSCECGRRFETWLKHNAPDELVWQGTDAFREITPGSGDAKREVTLQGVVIRWPLKAYFEPLRRSVDQISRRVPRFD